MIRQLIVSYVLLVAVALAAFTVPVAFTLTAQLRGDTEESVEREATTMALLLGEEDASSRQALARMAGAYSEDTPGTVQVVSSTGTAVASLPSPRTTRRSRGLSRTMSRRSTGDRPGSGAGTSW